MLKILAKSLIWLVVSPFNQGLAATLDFPPNIVVPNYDQALIGQIPGLEAGAFVARTNDPAANWYNPAGLMQADRTAINTSSSAYGWTAIKISAASGANVGGINGSDVPGFFGVVIGSPVIDTKQWRIGLSLSRELSWSPALQTKIQQESAGITQQVSYSVRDSFNQYVPAFSLGYSPTDELRLGAGVNVSSISYQGSNSLTNQQLAPTTQNNTVHVSQINGNVVNLLFSVGGQYDLSDHWNIGLFMRSPSLRLFGNSTLTYESLTVSGGQTSDVFFYDNSASFSYTQSFQTTLGLAYKTSHFEVEADVRYHAPVEPYAYIKSTQPIITTSNSGGAPATTSQSFTEISNTFKHVLNGAVGVKYDLSPFVGLHSGFFTSYSPVKDSSSATFRQIDLYGVTFGASVILGSLSGSLGGAYEWGTSDPFVVTNALSGQEILTTVSLTNVKVLYSLSFKL
jgi:hypothetical protein